MRDVPKEGNRDNRMELRGRLYVERYVLHLELIIRIDLLYLQLILSVGLD